MRIAPRLLTIVAVAVVARCSQVDDDIPWATVARCLRKEEHRSPSTVLCVTTQMFVQFNLNHFTKNCGHCSYLFLCQAGRNAVHRCGNNKFARKLVSIVSVCAQLTMRNAHREAILCGRDGTDCEAMYGCPHNCTYSPKNGLCSKSNCRKRGRINHNT